MEPLNIIERMNNKNIPIPTYNNRLVDVSVEGDDDGVVVVVDGDGVTTTLFKLAGVFVETGPEPVF